MAERPASERAGARKPAAKAANKAAAGKASGKASGKAAGKAGAAASPAKAGRRASTKSDDLSVEAFLALPDAQKAAPVVVAVGDEPFLQAEVRAALARALPRAETFEAQAKKTGWEPAPLLDELRSASLFSPEKLVRVRDAEALLTLAPEALIAHAEAAPRGRTLLLEMTTLDRRTRVGKALADGGLVVSCKRLYAEAPPWHRGPAWDTPLARWVQARFAARAKRVSLEDAYHLTQITGGDLNEAAQTLEKVCLLVGDREAVGPDDLDAVAARARRDGAFALAHAIAMRQPGRSLELLRSAFRHGVEVGRDVVTDEGGIAVIVLGALHRTWRDARRARAWLQAGNGADARALGAALGIAPFAAPRVLDVARAFSGADMDDAYRALLACDRGVKGRLGARSALERLVAVLGAAGGPVAPTEAY